MNRTKILLGTVAILLLAGPAYVSYHGLKRGAWFNARMSGIYLWMQS